MSLGHEISMEQQVNPDQVMLLRHSNSKVKTLLAAGGNLHEFSAVQPVDSIYDFYLAGKPRIRVVVVIVNDRVHGVYRVNGIVKSGTTRTLVSPQFRQWDIQQGYPEKLAKLFQLDEVLSRYNGMVVSGWKGKRHPVARYGHRLFESVVAP